MIPVMEPKYWNIYIYVILWAMLVSTLMDEELYNLTANVNKVFPTAAASLYKQAEHQLNEVLAGNSVSGYILHSKCLHNTDRQRSLKHFCHGEWVEILAGSNGTWRSSHHELSDELHGRKWPAPFTVLCCLQTHARVLHKMWSLLTEWWYLTPPPTTAIL